MTDNMQRFLFTTLIVTVVLFCVGISNLIRGCDPAISGLCSFSEITGPAISYNVYNITCHKGNLKNYNAGDYNCYNGYLVIYENSTKNQCEMLVIEHSTSYSTTVENMQTYDYYGKQHHVYLVQNNICEEVSNKFKINTHTGIALLSISGLLILGLGIYMHKTRCHTVHPNDMEQMHIGKMSDDSTVITILYN